MTIVKSNYPETRPTLNAANFKIGLGGFRHAFELGMEGLFLLHQSGSGYGDGSTGWEQSTTYGVYSPSYNHSTKELRLVKVGELKEFAAAGGGQPDEYRSTLSLDGKEDQKTNGYLMSQFIPRIWMND